MKTPATLNAQAGRAGFTIVEMLITIGAVAIITLGLAKLFSATSETFRIGRRVSALNEYAANIERVLRSDIGRMSRNRGFLLIRNREVTDSNGVTQTNPGGGILLSPDDPGFASRVRRVDEFMFFQEGSFTSLRDPLNPARTASGSAARIYYGHGLRQVYNQNPSSYILDISDQALSSDSAYNRVRPTFGLANPSISPQNPEYPNRYASDWILLRHTTVLAPPQATATIDPPPGSTATFPDKGTWGDSSWQIGLQPAAPDIFRAITAKYPKPTTWARSSSAAGEPLVLPAFSTGVIDVAGVDLSSIRSRVLNAAPLAKANSLAGSLYLAADSGDNLGAFFPYDADPSIITNSAYLMKQWMIQAMPNGPVFGTEGAGEAGRPERRMHCELTPPDLMGTVANRTPPTPFDDARAFLRTDQAMLAASNFVPGCTEFIVEWSFGDLYNKNNTNNAALWGKLVWHGMTRYADVPGPAIGQTTTQLVCEPYPVDNFTGDIRPGATLPYIQQVYTGTDGSTIKRTKPVQPGLIHIPASGGGGGGGGGGGAASITPGDPIQATVTSAAYSSTTPQPYPLYSCFGYLDPTFQAVPSKNDPATIPWPWPRMLRITIGLVDSATPTQEFRYQFVFDIPSSEAP